MDIAARVEQLERQAGVPLPEPYRSILISQNGRPWTINEGEPTEIFLWGIDRLEETHDAFQEGYGAPARGVLTIGSWFGRGFTIGVNAAGQIVDLFGGPEMWTVIAGSLEAFLVRVDREGVGWVNDFHRHS